MDCPVQIIKATAVLHGLLVALKRGVRAGAVWLGAVWLTAELLEHCTQAEKE